MSRRVTYCGAGKVSQPGLYTISELNDMINNNGYIPVASGAELNALRTTTLQQMGFGTLWNGMYTTGVDKKYVQVRHITLEDYQTGTGWSPIVSARIYDGNELDILDMFILDNTTNGRGLFGTSTSSSHYLNIRLTGDVTAGNGNSGILVGIAQGGTIENCHTYGTIAGAHAIGGICGAVQTNATDFINCKNYATVSGTFYVAGINAFNYVQVTFDGCENHGDITSSSNYCAGIHAYGTVLSIENCRNYGDITGGGNNTAGIHALGDVAISYCDNHGDITGKDAAGIHGIGIATITECNNHGTITGEEAGGISASYGLGTHKIDFIRCENFGTITTYQNGIGRASGIGVLMNASTAIDCYNWGIVRETTGNANINIGGCFAYLYGGANTVTNCYNKGLVDSSVQYAGGLVGRLYNGSVTNSYYDSQTSGQSDTGKGLPRTTAQMKAGTASSFINPDGSVDGGETPANAMYTAWDTGVWDFGTTNDYPILK